MPGYVVDSSTTSWPGCSRVATSLTALFTIDRSGSRCFDSGVARAMRIVGRIVSGKSSSTVHVGATAFLGVEIDASSGYDQIVAVVPGGPADAAGLEPGDVITAVGRRAVSSSTALASLLFTKHPGDRLSVTYDDGYGSTQTTTVTLGSGPPQ